MTHDMLNYVFGGYLNEGKKCSAHTVVFFLYEVFLWKAQVCGGAIAAVVRLESVLTKVRFKKI